MTSKPVPSRRAATWRPLGGSERRMAPAPPVLATLTRSIGAAAGACSDAAGAGGPELIWGGRAATGVGRKCGVLSENTARGLKLAMSLASCEGPALAILLTTKKAPI